MITDGHTMQDPERHFRSLGICWMVYGLIRLIAAAWLVSFSATATVMFGALLNRVPDPFSMMNVFHVLYTVAIVWSVVCGVLGIFAGLVLATGQRSGQILTIIAAVLSLSDIPLGITLGTYSLVVLLPIRVVGTSTAMARERVSDFRSHPSTT